MNSQAHATCRRGRQIHHVAGRTVARLPAVFCNLIIYMQPHPKDDVPHEEPLAVRSCMGGHSRLQVGWVVVRVVRLGG